MPDLSKLGPWILALLPFLTWGMPVSAVSGPARAPETATATWGDSSFLQRTVPLDVGYPDITLPPEWDTGPPLSSELALLPSATVALSTAAPDTSISGESNPPRRLILCILILFLLGALVKYVRSPGFYDLVSNVCFALYDIEHEGQDGRP